jgi:hypothetical protein
MQTKYLKQDLGDYRMGRIFFLESPKISEAGFVELGD